MPGRAPVRGAGRGWAEMTCPRGAGGIWGGLRGGRGSWCGRSGCGRRCGAVVVWARSGGGRGILLGGGRRRVYFGLSWMMCPDVTVRRWGRVDGRRRARGSGRTGSLRRLKLTWRTFGGWGKCAGKRGRTQGKGEVRGAGSRSVTNWALALSGCTRSSAQACESWLGASEGSGAKGKGRRLSTTQQRGLDSHRRQPRLHGFSNTSISTGPRRLPTLCRLPSAVPALQPLGLPRAASPSRSLPPDTCRQPHHTSLLHPPPITSAPPSPHTTIANTTRTLHTIALRLYTSIRPPHLMYGADLRLFRPHTIRRHE